jgi:hypothetical protein
MILGIIGGRNRHSHSVLCEGEHKAMKHFIRTLKSINRQERGSQAQAMVEFALVLPLLLLLLIAIIDFGRALFVYSQVSNAAREAVRYAATSPDDCAEIANRARNSMYSLGPDGPIAVAIYIETPNTSGDFSIKGLCGTVALERGDRIKVDISTSVSPYTLQMIAPLFGGNFTDLPITYSAARSVVPPEGIATGPTTTPRNTKTPLPIVPPPTDTPTPEPLLPPEAPTNFDANVANCANGKTDASWTAPSGGGAVAYYRIFDAANPAVFWDVTGTSTSNFTTVPNNSSRTFYVVAYNALNVPGPASNIDTVTCGIAATLTPSNTPTNTPTRTPTATPSNTPTNTPTPTNTTTPTPGPSPTPTNTLTPTPTPSPTPTPAPIQMEWAAGYPVRQQTGSNKQAFFKVRVTFLDNTPVNDATVYLYNMSTSQFINYLTLVPSGDGYYGISPASSFGDCLNIDASADVLAQAYASRGGATANVTGITLSGKYDVCP